MLQKLKVRMCALGILAATLTGIVHAETVGLFFDAAVPQHSFAAGDVKEALQSKGFTVETLGLAQLNASYANKKVVIALASNTAVTPVLTTQGGALPASLPGEQAYWLSTSATPQKSYWVLGGDVNGAMYGGFQITDNIKLNGFNLSYNEGESPYTKERGAKFNIPMDGRSPTYSGHFDGESFSRALLNVWDVSFWKEWLDAKARNRYNMLSLWTDHPFTAMVSVPGYEDCILTDVQDPSGKVIKTMSINEKIEHWRQVTAHAHARGFRTYIVTWNLYTHGATGKHGITEAATNQNTTTYMAKSMAKLLETYPDLDGFGCTAGEHMDVGSDTQKETFLWNAYGKPMLDFAIANPSRKLTFIHRFHYATSSLIFSTFKTLAAQPNVNFSTSIKYSQAKMLSTTIPKLMTGSFAAVKSNNSKTYLTIRNDDLYFLDWGDPVFARTYIKGIYEGKTADLKYISGWYIGSDGWCPTRTWHVKEAGRQNELEVKRLWFFDMVWGRLSYNPEISDDVFRNAIKLRYPQVDPNSLYNAWTNASKAFQVTNEYIVGKHYFDFMYYPETQKHKGGYRTAGDFKGVFPPAGSDLGKDANKPADSAIKCAEAALTYLSTVNTGGNPDLQSKIKNLKALAWLSLYVGEKIRGANGGGSSPLGKAYCHWINYANLMDEMHVGQSYQRVAATTPNWHSVDKNVLSDYGSGAPACPTGARPMPVAADKKPAIGIRSLSPSAIMLDLQSEQGFSVEVFKTNGIKVAKLSKLQNTKGVSRFALGKKLPHGVYMVRLKSANQVLVREMNVVAR